MHIVVPVKLVPELVEELAVDESGAALDTTIADNSGPINVGNRPKNWEGTLFFI